MRKNQRRQPMASINVVPYIDVMLVLLVIFMITTPLLSQGVQVDLPQASAKPMEASEEEPLIVSVDSKGSYYLNVGDKPDNPIDERELVNQVAALLTVAKKDGHERRVFVKGDEHVDYGHVMQAMVMLQQAGAPSVGLMTQPKA